MHRHKPPSSTTTTVEIDLRAGITPIEGTADSWFEANRVMCRLLYLNYRQLEFDYPPFSYMNLYEQYAAGAQRVRIPTAVLEKLIEIGNRSLPTIAQYWAHVDDVVNICI
jgi:hypothetical protein